MAEMREWWGVPMDLENSPGSHRQIPEADMQELRAIYEKTGDRSDGCGGAGHGEKAGL